MSSNLQIRRLTVADLGFANALTEIAGWNQRDVDWRRLIQYGRGGCFLGQWEGEPAATITTTIHGDQIAWIGMVLVHPRFRRRGIATTLMKHAIEHLRQRGVRCIKLDATAAGQRVYQQLGFREEWSIDRWLRDGTNRAVSIEPISFDATELDVQAFGCPRQRWVDLLAERSSAYLYHRDGELAGYGLLRSGRLASYLGPVVATSADGAKKILTQLLKRHEGAVLWDIPESNQSAVRMAEVLGFHRTRQLVRMWTGESFIGGVPEMQYAIGDFSTG